MEIKNLANCCQYKDREVNLKELEKILLPEKKKSVYDLEVGDMCWIVWASGGVEEFGWDDASLGFKGKKQGRVFLTEKEAKLKSTREVINEELRRYAELNNDEEIDWTNSNQGKWVLRYQLKGRYFALLNKKDYFNPNDVYFTSGIAWCDVVNHISKERLLKEWVGIDDE